MTSRLNNCLSAIAFCFALLPDMSSATDPVAPSFSSLFGRWKTERIIAFADITASDKDGNAGIGTIVTISATEIKDTYETSATCTPRKPMIVYENTDSKLREDFGTREEDVHLPAQVLRSRMPYLEAGCAIALIISRDQMMWPLGNGFYYLARRLKN